MSIKDYRRYGDLQENEWTEEEFPSTPEGEKTGVQLAPIVQPLAIVPYNTQEQPLFQYADSTDFESVEAYEDDEQEEYVEYKSQGRRKVTFVPIFLILLSILILGILILGEFVLKEYLLVTPEMSGYAHLMDTIKILTAGEALIIADLIIPCAIALVGLFSLLNIIANLIKIKSRGACAVSKICLFFMIALSLALILINMINQETIEYGLYGIAGLSFISLLVGYLAKKSNNT